MMALSYFVTSLAVLCTLKTPFTSCIDSPKITAAYHTSINSIRLTWTLPSTMKMSSLYQKVTDGRLLGGFNVTIMTLDYWNNINGKVTLYQDAKDIIFVARHTKEWTFWNLEPAKSYVACVQTVTDKEGSTWSRRTVRPEGRRPPGLVRTSPPLIIVKGTTFYHNPVILHCLADGIPKPNITWFRNGQVLQPDWKHAIKSNGSLSIKYNKGTYFCTAKNDYGLARSGITQLRPSSTMNTQPISSSEITMVVKLHHDTMLECPVPLGTTASSITITWDRLKNKRDRQPKRITYSNRIIPMPNGSVLFTNVKREDAGLYECRMHGTWGSHGGQFRTVTVTEESHGRPIPTRPISASNQSILAIGGSALALYCAFAGWPTPNVTWAKDSKSIKHGGPFLRIRNVTAEHAGIYRCTGGNGAGMNITRAITVTVESGPVWMEKPADVNVTEGDDVVFRCSARGTPHPAPTWYINGNPFRTTNINKMSVLGHKLRIKNVSRQTDLMALQCNVSNKYGSLHQSAYLNVMRPTRITKSPKNILLPHASDVIFECNAETDPGSVLFIDWFHNNSRVHYQKDKMYKREDNSLLIMKSKKTFKERGLLGNYTCVASNGVSRDQRSARLGLAASVSDDKNETTTSSSSVPLLIICSISVFYIYQLILNKDLL